MPAGMSPGKLYKKGSACKVIVCYHDMLHCITWLEVWATRVNAVPEVKTLWLCSTKQLSTCSHTLEC